jgi:long-subunit acyl-CoA synthetase (AMP-forming)
MGTPKLVQLTHENILSQQAAMKVLWNLKSTDRFLSYLPWHHSLVGFMKNILLSVTVLFFPWTIVMEKILIN